MLGAIFMNGKGEASIIESEFTNCVSIFYGGALLIQFESSITSCLFDYCKTSGF
jgi:hypothetical protein